MEAVWATWLREANGLCPFKSGKAQGDNRAAKDEDRKLRDNIASASHICNGKLVAARKLWSVRRARTRAKKAAQMIAWSSGAPGWKNELRRVAKSATEVLKAEEGDEPCADTNLWKPIVKNFYDSIYFDEEEYVMKFHTELQLVVEEATATHNDLVITIQDIDRGIATFGGEKAAGKDDVSADVFKYLTEEDKQSLAHHFNLRLNGQCPKPETWHAPTCVLLPKIFNAQLIKHFRPIAISTVAARLFDKILLHFLQPYISEYRGNQIANRKTYQASEGIQQVRRAMEKAKLTATPLCIAKLDVEKAFDKVRHEALFRALERMNVPKKAIDAIK